MDNSNMQGKVNSQSTVVPQAANVPNPAPTGSDSSSSKMVLWLVLGLVLIIVAVGGIYWYLSDKQKSLTNTQTTTQTETQTAPENLDTLGAQADSANVPDGAEDFSALDKDLQNL